MSDLVEKVARKMTDASGYDPDEPLHGHDRTGQVAWMLNETKARAAIKAVAEWLDDQCNADKKFIVGQLRYEASKEGSE